MVESLYSVLPALPALPALSAEAQGWLIAAVSGAMAFFPVWRAGKSLCDGIDRINARKADMAERGRAIGFHNRPGEN